MIREVRRSLPYLFNVIVWTESVLWNDYVVCHIPKPRTILVLLNVSLNYMLKRFVEIRKSRYVVISFKPRVYSVRTHSGACSTKKGSCGWIPSANYLPKNLASGGTTTCAQSDA